MRVGVTVVNLNPVSAPDWLYGLGFLTWEKQQSNSHNNKTIQLNQLPPQRTPALRDLTLQV